MNTENCCRICLTEYYTGYNLQEHNGESTIHEMIKKICPEIHLDGKPDQICIDCLTQLKTACDFKQKCETSDSFLKNISLERKFKIFDDTEDATIDDFIDTNLFDQDLFDADYIEDLKPDFDSLDPKTAAEFSGSHEENKLNPVDQQVPAIQEKRKFSRSQSTIFKCSLCPEKFTLPSKLIQHSRYVHKNLKPFKCNFPDCGKIYKLLKALKVHQKLHENVLPFKCDECQASFHVKSNLLAHLRTHTGEKFKCSFPNCNKSFNSINYRKQHIELHALTENVSQQFVCVIVECKKSFHDKESLRLHQICHKEKKFDCEICKMKFKTRQSLKIHQLKHTDIKQFTCHICGVLFKYRNQCYDHVRAHTAKREFECFHCSKKFIKKTLLANHMQTHLTVRMFKCNECHKTFKTDNCLYKHRRRHRLIIGKFLCAFCDKNFTSRSDLTNHVRTHTQEKQFACHFEGCQKNFIHKSNLNVHIRSHLESEGFNCDLCGKNLANSNALRNHLNRVHKAEKKFGCELCTLRFASIQLLNIHSEIHKPKKFGCSMCNRRYNFAADLERHVSKMHPQVDEMKDE